MTLFIILPDEKMMEIIMKKKKNIAWFVSNCLTKSRRAILGKRMMELTTIDIYGNCGPLKCQVDHQPCLDMLTTDYKFYLSFENSLCRDYITEKIYRPLTQYVIPIVFNGGNTTLFAPPKSFINANDFDTVKDLVKYLEFLSNNPKEYIKYFWWKKHYRIKSHPVYQYSLCELCMKLHNETFMQSPHRYQDINAWYRDDMCNQKAHINF
jgi:alpha-1,3-fucosyltransferase